MPEPCDSCAGSKRCTICGGQGMIINGEIQSFCNPCDGSGVCAVCHGTGENPPTFD
jgi:hypothetical protein